MLIKNEQNFKLKFHKTAKSIDNNGEKMVKLSKKFRNKQGGAEVADKKGDV